MLINPGEAIADRIELPKWIVSNLLHCLWDEPPIVGAAGRDRESRGCIKPDIQNSNSCILLIWKMLEDQTRHHRWSCWRRWDWIGWDNHSWHGHFRAWILHGRTFRPNASHHRKHYCNNWWSRGARCWRGIDSSELPLESREEHSIQV